MAIMNKSKLENQEKPIHYWFVDITLTSGEVLEFYVKALTISDAYDKANEYTYWVSNEKLLSLLRKFKFMS